jgi:hypothetical protein
MSRVQERGEVMSVEESEGWILQCYEEIIDGKSLDPCDEASG